MTKQFAAASESKEACFHEKPFKSLQLALRAVSGSLRSSSSFKVRSLKVACS